MEFLEFRQMIQNMVTDVQDRVLAEQKHNLMLEEAPIELLEMHLSNIETLDSNPTIEYSSVILGTVLKWLEASNNEGVSYSDIINRLLRLLRENTMSLYASSQLATIVSHLSKYVDSDYLLSSLYDILKDTNVRESSPVIECITQCLRIGTISIGEDMRNLLEGSITTAPILKRVTPALIELILTEHSIFESLILQIPSLLHDALPDDVEPILRHLLSGISIKECSFVEPISLSLCSFLIKLEHSSVNLSVLSLRIISILIKQFPFVLYNNYQDLVDFCLSELVKGVSIPDEPDLLIAPAETTLHVLAENYGDDALFSSYSYTTLLDLLDSNDVLTNRAGLVFAGAIMRHCVPYFYPTFFTDGLPRMTRHQMSSDIYCRRYSYKLFSLSLSLFLQAYVRYPLPGNDIPYTWNVFRRIFYQETDPECVFFGIKIVQMFAETCPNLITDHETLVQMLKPLVYCEHPLLQAAAITFLSNFGNQHPSLLNEFANDFLSIASGDYHVEMDVYLAGIYAATNIAKFVSNQDANSIFDLVIMSIRKHDNLYFGKEVKNISTVMREFSKILPERARECVDLSFDLIIGFLSRSDLYEISTHYSVLDDGVSVVVPIPEENHLRVYSLNHVAEVTETLRQLCMNLREYKSLCLPYEEPIYQTLRTWLNPWVYMSIAEMIVEVVAAFTAVMSEELSVSIAIEAMHKTRTVQPVPGGEIYRNICNRFGWIDEFVKTSAMFCGKQLEIVGKMIEKALISEEVMMGIGQSLSDDICITIEVVKCLKVFYETDPIQFDPIYASSILEKASPPALFTAMSIFYQMSPNRGSNRHMLYKACESCKNRVTKLPYLRDEAALCIGYAIATGIFTKEEQQMAKEALETYWAYLNEIREKDCDLIAEIPINHHPIATAVALCMSGNEDNRDFSEMLMSFMPLVIHSKTGREIITFIVMQEIERGNEVLCTPENIQALTALFQEWAK